MDGLAAIFINNLLPVILIAGIGYVLGKGLDVNPRPLSQLLY